MRVLIVTPAFWPQIGGAERMLYELARGLSEAGASVRVLTPTPGETIDEPFQVRRLPQRYTFYRQHTVMPWAVAQHIREFRPDLVQTSGPNITELSALAAGALRKLPIVSIYQGDYDQTIPVARLYTAAHVAALRGFARIVTTNEQVARNLRARGIDAAKLMTMPPGVSSIFAPGKLSDASPFLLFVGALDESHLYKRVELLLAACALAFPALPGYSLKIAGRGPLTERYRLMAAELGIGERVEFLTSVDDAELAELYRSARAFVLASSTIQEGFGIVAIEAMASGCPAVVTTAVGCAEFVHAAHGAVVAPNDARAMAGGILALLADPERRARASRQAVAATVPLRWPAIARRWLDEIYAPLVR